MKIAQEHNWIVNFIKQKILQLKTMSQQQAKYEVMRFIQNLRSHFLEEEQIMFPFALEQILYNLNENDDSVLLVPLTNNKGNSKYCMVLCVRSCDAVVDVSNH